MPTDRLYYNDSYLRDFTAQVLSCDPIPPDVAAGRTQQAWAVTLDRTAHYPTSGGQPHDRGKLNEANILDVRDDEQSGEILHIVDRKLPCGEVTGCVDWPRRFDHMQQHTGQHLLSAMFQERFGLATISFHLGETFCTIDLQGPEPTDAILVGIERITNQIIFEDRPILIRYATPEQLATMGVRKQVSRQGMLRVIEIANADLQPCGGTHVASTGQIGIVLLRRKTKIRQDWRIEFVCGARAATAARNDHRHLRDAAHTLNCAPEELPSAVQRIQSERDAHYVATRTLAEQLAKSNAQLTLELFPETTDQFRVIDQLVDSPTPDYLTQYAAALNQSAKVIVLLANPKSGDLLFAQHPNSGADMSALLKQIFTELSGKGGGNKNHARGKLTSPDQATAARALERAKTLL
jgi:alanyl-tRNA synthetase